MAIHCMGCGNNVPDLEVFPGPRCLACHAKKIDRQPLERPDFIGAINFGKKRTITEACEHGKPLTEECGKCEAANGNPPGKQRDQAAKVRAYKRMVKR